MDKPTSIYLGVEDRKRAAKLRKLLSEQYGKISLAFVFRQALRALEEATEKKVA